MEELRNVHFDLQYKNFLKHHGPSTGTDITSSRRFPNSVFLHCTFTVCLHDIHIRIRTSAERDYVLRRYHTVLPVSLQLTSYGSVGDLGLK